MGKIVLAISIILLLLTAMCVGFVRPVVADGTIYIRADGSVEGTTHISSADNATYTFTDNIYDEIVVERDNIVIDGAGYTLQGTGGGVGIHLSSRSNVTIKNMEIKTFYYSIWMNQSSHNIINGNNITANNGFGIRIIYLSSNIRVSENNITNNDWFGIGLGYYSNHSSIFGNHITNNSKGMELGYSSNNTIYHNNFLGNTQQVFSETSGYANLWDDNYPSGGNYWSDYNGTDAYYGENATGLPPDGIGDTRYTIDANNTDRYPLMGMFSDFNATREHDVQTICNSSISDFQCNGTAICFNVTGENGTTGFCRMCIPTGLMNATYKVFVNGTEVSYTLLPCSNSTYSYLFFSYEHSTQEVVIVSEFSTWTSVLFIFVLVAVVIVIYKRRQLKMPIRKQFPFSFS